ncbi:metalloregulator ArsR/SmtB family transcription factor [Gammaproteobacteria bacterium]|nr:metalloregulator ArsR/SmtB family transcription factor [Gammaproteobacteria bacterium]
MSHFETLITALKACGESTRLRLVLLLNQGELTVTELTQILNQSQPRISRHLKTLLDAGILKRQQEGNWMFYRTEPHPELRAVMDAILANVELNANTLRADTEGLNQVRAERVAAASRWFADNAHQWDQLRRLHLDEAEVESAMLACIGDRRFSRHLDLGTGTGRMLALFAGNCGQSLGVDNNHEMLQLARGRIDDEPLPLARVQQANLLSLSLDDATADLVTIHNVLHYLDDPSRAIAEAARVMQSGAMLLIVDFAPHNLEWLRETFHHRRLGIDDDQLRQWVEQSGLELLDHRRLPTSVSDGEQLEVSLWCAQKA